MENEKDSYIPLPERFCADIIRSDGRTTRVYITKLKSRIETRYPGLPGVIISHLDKQMLYSLDEKKQTYLEFPIPENRQDFDPYEECYWTYIGTETMEGEEFEKYEIRFEKTDTFPGVVCYINAKSKMRTKIITYNKLGQSCLTIEYKNVLFDFPENDFFEIPANYKKEELNEAALG